MTASIRGKVIESTAAQPRQVATAQDMPTSENKVINIS